MFILHQQQTSVCQSTKCELCKDEKNVTPDRGNVVQSQQISKDRAPDKNATSEVPSASQYHHLKDRSLNRPNPEEIFPSSGYSG